MFIGFQTANYVLSIELQLSLCCKRELLKHINNHWLVRDFLIANKKTLINAEWLMQFKPPMLFNSLDSVP